MFCSLSWWCAHLLPSLAAFGPAELPVALLPHFSSLWNCVSVVNRLAAAMDANQCHPPWVLSYYKLWALRILLFWTSDSFFQGSGEETCASCISEDWFSQLSIVYSKLREKRLGSSVHFCVCSTSSLSEIVF